MKLILSPTKQMRTSKMAPLKVPCFLEQSKQIYETLRTLRVEDLCRVMKIKEDLAKETMQRYQQLTFSLEGTPALFAYHGLQFKHLYPDDFTAEECAYAQEHLRILSGFYGLLHPMDAIQPYRLEMQTRLSIGDAENLYAFWKDSLAQQLLKEEGCHPCMINLASKEYAKAILPYLPVDCCWTITFYVEKDGKRKTASTQVKMARGLMARWMIKKQIQTVEDLLLFDEDGYRYCTDGGEHELVFVKKE